MGRLVVWLGIAGLAAGCAAPSGLIFTRTVQPLTTDLRATPVVASGAKGDVKQIDYSYARVQWSANGLGEIAKNAGFTEIYYADLETFRVLGVWTQQWARVYGKR